MADHSLPGSWRAKCSEGFCGFLLKWLQIAEEVVEDEECILSVVVEE